ncbi:hypothetical protein [Hoeflea marina]|uniref:hypothetical protein n=1 Tax=Hoeflea marina TaxID=274592 RepID=UPI0011B38734|nr:hypothetical protein [Hoeflea marina]
MSGGDGPQAGLRPGAAHVRSGAVITIDAEAGTMAPEPGDEGLPAGAICAGQNKRQVTAGHLPEDGRALARA